MPEFVPRFLVVVTGIVAVLALIIGIKDYVQKSNYATHSASVDVPVAAHPTDTPARKKHSSRKAKRAEPSQAELSAESTAASNSRDGLTIEGDSITNDGSAFRSTRMSKSHSVRDESHFSLVTKSCAPLPNSTKLEDVDAPYYQKWAREYGCNAD